AALLAEGVIRTMFLNKVKWAAAILFLAGVASLGAGLAARGPGSAPRERPVANQAADDADRPAAKAAEDRENPVDQARARVRIRRSLRELAVAVHNYHDAHGHLPLPAITDRTGKPLLSWRVALLPFMEHDNLYKQFRLDEPWDGPNNRKLIDKMPAIFA